MATAALDLAETAAGLHLSEAPDTKGNPESDAEESNEEMDDVAGLGKDGVGSQKKRKKKRKPKKKTHYGIVPRSMPPPPPETPEETARWKEELRRGRTTIDAGPWGLLEPSFKDQLDLLLTPSCAAIDLETRRLRLRACRPSDLAALTRIKLEPIVQKTQLYGAPTPSDIKDSFLNRYVRASIPRIGPLNTKRCRDDYIFAITLKDPHSIKVKSGDDLLPSSRITDATGYIGNIALHFKVSTTVRSYNTKLFPLPGKLFHSPTFSTCAASKLSGELFYEIHPQLWGHGLMSEAFEEVLRFAMEEIGCVSLAVDPTEGNYASIKLAEKNGMKYSHTSIDNPFGKPQMFHTITREDWWARNRPNKEIRGAWEGKGLCRWCMNVRQSEPTISCDGCKWAKYCSRQCQRADWIMKGGHQSECGSKHL